MKFRKLLPIFLFSIGALAGCGSDKPSGNYSVVINNESVITATWNVGDANRSLDLTIKAKDKTSGEMVEGNVTQELMNGKLVVSSSKTNVLSCNGVSLSALEAGTTTLKVKYYDAVATLDLTIGSKPTNKDKFGTVHEGTAEDPFDNTDAIKVGLWAKDNGNTEELYIKGTIKSFYHAPGSRTDGLVSYYLEEVVTGEGNFEVYKCTGADGTTALTNDDIWKGGVATAYGVITYYASASQAETTAATFVSCTGTKPDPQQTIEATVTEVLAAGAALADGDSSYDLYKFTGYVVKMDGTNFFIAEAANETDAAKMIELYAFSDTGSIMLKNAKVTVTMQIKNYHSVIENSGTPTVTLVTAGEAWEIAYTDVTIAEALTAGAALADGATSTPYYRVTGFVIVITSAYNSTYGNVSFTFGATADATTDLLTVFRLTVTSEEAATVVVGAELTLGGKLQKYVSGDTTTIELVSGKIVEKGTPAPTFTADLTVDFSLDNGISADKVTANTAVTIGEIEYGYLGGKQGNNYSTSAKEYLMLYYENSGSFWNNTAFGKAISAIRITTGSSASTTAVYSLTVGTAALAGQQPSASATEGYVIGAGATHIFDCSGVASATYFNVSAFTKNCQIAKFEVQFVA